MEFPALHEPSWLIPEHKVRGWGKEEADDEGEETSGQAGRRAGLVGSCQTRLHGFRNPYPS